jgi:tagaturonate reductase
VLNRYRNPFISFDWLNICVEDTSKLRIRAVPIVLQHFAKHGYIGERIATGFAAYILFMKGGQEYVIVDEQAGLLREKWERYPGGPELVKSVLEDERLWGVDLYALKGFGEKVSACIESLLLSDVKK